MHPREDTLDWLSSGIEGIASLSLDKHLAVSLIPKTQDRDFHSVGKLRIFGLIAEIPGFSLV